MNGRRKIAALSMTILLVATLACPAAAQTGVFVNGRELSIAEVVQIQRCMPVIPGNYWMDGQGTFGYVGGGPIGNLITAVSRLHSQAHPPSRLAAELRPSMEMAPPPTTGPTAASCPDGGCMVDGVSCPN